MHYKLIQSLINEIRKLRREVADLRQSYEEAAYVAEENYSRCSRKLQAAQREARQAQEDTDYQEYSKRRERDDALNDLERARRYEDEYAERRALDRLKRL